MFEKMCWFHSGVISDSVVFVCVILHNITLHEYLLFCTQRQNNTNMLQHSPYIMKSGTHYYPSPRVVCTESESVSLAQICTLSSLRAEPRHLTQLYCHWCSKCFEKTRAHSLRVDHVSCLPFITSCMLLQNTCEIMKKANTATVWFVAEKYCVYKASATASRE